jgi:hypothetical protein
VTKACIHQLGSKASSFEQNNGLTYEAALVTELQNMKTGIKTSEVSNFCMTVAGKSYGILEFKSKPTGAKIIVDKDEQRRLTNSKWHFTTGKHDWEIIYSDGKKCSGAVEVEQLKTETIEVRKKDCK